MRKRPAVAAVLAGVVLVSALGAAFALRDADPVDLEEQARRLAADKVRYSAALRQSPVTLADELVAGALQEGDAVSSDDHFEDYFVYQAPDSTAFSIIVTADAFQPDLVVTTPRGNRIAASTLMQTDRRAEVVGLVGPGQFEITVTTRLIHQRGAYEISAGDTPEAIVVSSSDPVHDSELGRGGTLRAGRYEQSYLVEARPDQPVILSLRSKEFTPTASLIGPQGQLVEPWSSLEQRVENDSTYVTVIRFKPGSEEPYLLLATSEERAAQGAYTLEFETVRVLAIQTDGDGVSAKLGERSWYKAGHYVDTYQFSASADDFAIVEVRSREFAPRIVLRRGEREVAMAEGSHSARIERTLGSNASYDVEVTSREAGGAGSYVVSVTIESPEGPQTQSFSTEARRVGASFRDHHFEITVSHVDISRRAGGKVRVQLNVQERSLDFGGEWDDWTRRARHAWVTDDTGRRYSAAPEEAAGGAGDVATPGSTRSGRLTFYGPSEGETPRSITIHYPIGANRGVIVSVPISLQR